MGGGSEGDTGDMEPLSEGETGVSVAIGIGLGDGRAEKTLVVPIEGVEIVVVGSTIPGVEDGQPVIATERKIVSRSLVIAQSLYECIYYKILCACM